MLIQIITTPNAQVTIDGKNVYSVDASIDVIPNEEQTKIVSTLTTFLKDTKVKSNVSNLTTDIDNDVDMDLDDLLIKAETAMIVLIKSLKYDYKLIN